MDALSLGQIDLGYVDPGPAINRYLQGGNVIALAGVCQGESVLVVRKDIPYTDVRDLERKIVATPSTGCTHDLILRKLLQESDMVVVENGDKVKRIAQKPATMIGLFQQKQINAALILEPWASIMEAQGVVKTIVDANEVPWEGNLPPIILKERGNSLRYLSRDIDLCGLAVGKGTWPKKRVLAIAPDTGERYLSMDVL